MNATHLLHVWRLVILDFQEPDLATMILVGSTMCTKMQPDYQPHLMRLNQTKLHIHHRTLASYSDEHYPNDLTMIGAYLMRVYIIVADLIALKDSY